MMAGGVVQLGRRFLALRRDDRWLVAEAVILIGVVHAGLRTLSFVSLRRLLGRAKRLPSRSRHSTQRIAWAIDAAARVVPGRTCLQDALAADVMLCRRGHVSTLRLGVKKDGGAAIPLQAHAWVESNGAIVAGRLESLDDYKAFPDVVTP